MELIFEVRDAEEGGFCARALGHGIFTQAEIWEELRANVLEAATLHFEDVRAAAAGPIALRKGRTHSSRGGVKLPRDVSADRLIGVLEGLGYRGAGLNG